METRKIDRGGWAQSLFRSITDQHVLLRQGANDFFHEERIPLRLFQDLLLELQEGMLLERSLSLFEENREQFLRIVTVERF